MSCEALSSQALAAVDKCKEGLEVTRETFDQFVVKLVCDEGHETCGMTQNTVAVVKMMIQKQFDEMETCLDYIFACTKQARQRCMESDKIIENLKKKLKEQEVKIREYETELNVKQSYLCKLARELEQLQGQLWLQVTQTPT